MDLLLARTSKPKPTVYRECGRAWMLWFKSGSDCEAKGIKWLEKGQPARWSCWVRWPDRPALSFSTCDFLTTSLRNGGSLNLQCLEFYEYLQSFRPGAG